MKLFRKIYIAVFCSFTIVAIVVTVFITMSAVDTMQKNIVNDNRTIANLVALEAQRGFVISGWPFESLKTLENLPDFKFWYIVTDSQMVYLANDVSCMGRSVPECFPNLPVISDTESIVLLPQISSGICIRRIEKNGQQWSFWLGFSTKRATAMGKKIIAVAAGTLFVILLVLGIVLYFVINHFTDPIRSLAKGAKEIGTGNLDFRLSCLSHDEVGSLAASFNAMAANLQQTTVSRNYLNVILASTQDALFVLEQGGSIMTVNPAACSILGFGEQNLVGMQFEKIITVVDDAHPILSLQQILKRGKISGEESCLLKATGETIPVLFNSTVVAGKDGNVRWIVCTAKDITERKKNEMALRATARQLERAFQCINEELDAARLMQNAFLPSLMGSYTGIIVAAAYVPCGTVGGDLYDVFKIDAHKTALIGIDVAGHGVPASLSSAAAKICFRQSIDRAENLDDALRDANTALLHSIPQTQFVAAFIGIFDSPTGLFRYVRAGLPKPLLLRAASTTVENLDGTGSILGILPEVIFEEKTVTLCKGDKVLIYTDGLTDGENADLVRYGRRRLQMVVQQAASKPMHEIIKTVIAENAAYLDKSLQIDDITILGFEVT